MQRLETEYDEQDLDHCKEVPWGQQSNDFFYQPRIDPLDCRFQLCYLLSTDQVIYSSFMKEMPWFFSVWAGEVLCYQFHHPHATSLGQYTVLYYIMSLQKQYIIQK